MSVKCTLGGCSAHDVVGGADRQRKLLMLALVSSTMGPVRDFPPDMNVTCQSYMSSQMSVTVCLMIWPPSTSALILCIRFRPSG